MKALTLLAIALTFGLTFSFASAGGDNERPSEIKFHEGSWASALEKARAENKPIFLDVYATWCGPCKLLKSKTFTDQEVADYFNEHFINVSLDAEKGDGVKVAKEFNVTALPSLFILNSQGEVILLSKGFKYPEDLIKLGKTGLNAEK